MEASIITWESEKNLTEVLHDWKVLYTRVYFGGGGGFERLLCSRQRKQNKSPLNRIGTSYLPLQISATFYLLLSTNGIICQDQNWKNSLRNSFKIQMSTLHTKISSHLLAFAIFPSVLFSPYPRILKLVWTGNFLMKPTTARVLVTF